jgi:signal transduction histidine kinase
LVEAIQDTRTLTFELSSPLLYKLGLEKAIAAWLRDQIGIPFNLETDFLDDGQEKPLTEDEQVILFRNVRELLVNVVHHAQATEIQVSIEREVANIIITVQDDGIGFDSGSALQYEYPEDGFGLFSIQERMADFGGSLEIISAPGMGCTAVLTAPLDLG